MVLALLLPVVYLTLGLSAMSISLSTPSVAQAQSAASSKTASAGKGTSTPDNTFTQLVDEQIAVLDGKGKTDKTAVVDEADSKGEAADGKDIRPDPATLAAMLGAPVLTEPVKPVVDTAVGEQVVAASDDGQTDLRLTTGTEGTAVVAREGDSEENAAAQAADEHHVPGLTGGFRLGDKCGEAGDVVRGLVHAQAGRDRAALPQLEAFALRRSGVLGQFHLGEHEQQALRLVLAAGGIKKILEVGEAHGNADPVEVGTLSRRRHDLA